MNKVVVLLHGWPKPINLTRGLCEFFREKGFRIVAPNYLEEGEHFGVKEVENLVENELNGEIPEVMMGLSLGGMILPHLAVKHPDAKLVFLASGPYLDIHNEWLMKAIQILSEPNGLYILKWLYNVPDEWLEKGYEAVHKMPVNKTDMAAYELDKKEVIKFIKIIKPGKHQEVAKFVLKCDNTGVLKQLKNKSLIFASRKDLIMPITLAEKLHKLLVNSRLIESRGSHWKVLDRAAMIKLGRFV